MRSQIVQPWLTVKLKHFKRLSLGIQPFQLANQLRVAVMTGLETVRNGTSVAAHGVGRLSGRMSQAGVGAAAIAVGIVMMTAMVTYAGPEAVGLLALALLAVAGLFFVFGTLAGYVRVDSAGPFGHLERAVAKDAELAFEIAAADGSVVYANAEAARLRGRSATSIEGLLSSLPGAADAAYRLAAATTRNETRSEDVFIPSAPRTLIASEPGGRWLRVSVKPFHPPVGVSDDRRMALWTAADISVDRRRETDVTGRLAAALAHYDTMPMGVAALAADGTLVHLNSTLQRLLHLDAVPTKPLALADVLTAGSAEMVLSALAGAQAGPAHFDVDLVREDGTAVPVHVVIEPHAREVRTADHRAQNSTVRTLLVLERQTRGTTAATRLDGTDDRFQRLFNSAPFGVATIDQGGCVINANAAFQRMFPDGDQAQNSIVKRLTGNAGQDQRKAVEAAIVRALAGRVSASPLEVGSGAEAQVARQLHINPLTVGMDPREAAVIYVSDATEQKSLELKFAQSQRMEAVGKLAGGIAHDFNNVLTVIIGLSDLLLQTRRPTDNGYGDIIQIRDNARRAASMVKQLLAFSRKQTLEPAVLAVNEVLQDFAFTFKKTIGEQIDVKHLPTRDLWPIKADRTQFDQVLLNLAVNAKDAMPNGGRLRLRAKNISERESLKFGGAGMPAGEYVLIEAEDTGMGMSSDVMTKIFEPFFTTKDVGKGTGLGLSTVYGIVKQTGGFIYAVSEIGRGTTFRVFLPRHIVTAEEEAATLAAVEAKKKEVPRDLTGTGRVLLVEDEDGVRGFAVRALQRQGYEVLEAISGVEALDVMAAEGGKIDLVVSDVIMPEMDGPTMYNEMIKTYPGLKIIFMSGYPSDAFDKTLDPKASFAFLQKPVNLVQLATKVKEVLAA
jgi:two-component system, cell cycle sensor histidine kinase and response regulator CckA